MTETAENLAPMRSHRANLIEQLPTRARVLIIRLRSMGDCVLTTPAISILKSVRPDLEIAVSVEPRWAAIFEGHPAISAVLGASLAEAFRWRPFLCINLHGGTRSQMLTLASGAAIRAGFQHHRGSSLYDVRVPRAQEILGEERPVHTAEHLASAMFYLGCPQQEIPRAQLFAPPADRARPYAVIHPAAAAAYKTWDPEGFVAIARHILATGGLEPVFIGGSGDDMRPFKEFECVAGAPLSEVKRLLSGASLFAGNDSGPAHIAAAFDVPLVVLFGRIEHRTTWAPWRASAARALANPGGIRAIQKDEVLAAINDLLQPHGRPA